MLPHETPRSASDPATAESRATTLLRLEGRDVLEVLHRISTQFLSDLQPGQARATLFTEFRGRLLHRAAVAVTSDGAVWLLRDDAAGDALAAHVERHVFREQVRMANAGAGRTVQRVPGATALEFGTLLEVDGVPVTVQLAEGEAYEVAIEPAVEDARAMERERILRGQPRHGHEIAEDFTPFEVGLDHEVHLSKGCFTGQEALMRLVTYRSVRRRLARVSGAGEPPSLPCDITLEGVRAGVLTSSVGLEPGRPLDGAVQVPPGAGWVGLAVLRSEACEPTAQLRLGDGAPLLSVEPFAVTRPLGLP
jgi:folate-binding protein YgfZ